MLKKDFNISEINLKMAAAFMRAKYDKLDDYTLSLLKKSEKEMLKCAQPKAVYDFYDILEISEDYVTLKGVKHKLYGKSISKHLKSCTKVCLLACTLSVSVDKIIHKYEVTDMSMAVVFDAVAGAYIEKICDLCEEEIKTLGYVIPSYRFGYGYDDLPIESMKDAIYVLEAGRNIGLNITDSNILVPTKSVVCIIGLKEGSEVNA